MSKIVESLEAVHTHTHTHTDNLIKKRGVMKYDTSL